MTDSDAGQAESGSGEPEADVDPLIGTLIGERYRVDEKLGVGGMGAVYRGEHVLMRKPVAVKVLHREMTTMTEVVKRFELEAIAAGRIDHPNVTVATDFGKLTDGSFYLVLEYVPGKSLTELIRAEAPLSVDRALLIARQAASGLGAAHAAGIVHRDLKPDNIMLIERGGTKDFVKVLDFGIAKVSSEAGSGNLTRVGAIFGTPAYMAPEQAAGQSVDHRADVYSLGLVVYEMLAGRPAFQSDDVIGLLTKQLIEPPPPLPETIDADVRALVMKMLEKDPEARLGSVEELIVAIDARLGATALPTDSTVFGASSPRAASIPDSQVSVESAPLASAVTSGLAETERFEPAKRAVVLFGKRLSALATRTMGGETVRAFGRDVPLWLAGAAAGAFVMAIVLGATLVRGGGSRPASALHNVFNFPAPAKDMFKVIERAAEGDRAAIAELARIPENERSAPEWLALGKGHAVLGKNGMAFEAFNRAVLLDNNLASDETVLRTVRRAVDEERTQAPALAFAAKSLGEPGADLLFDVSTTKPPSKSEAAQLAKSLLETDEVRRHASKALSIALDLRRTTRCDEAKRLLPQAIDAADDRSVRPLIAFKSRRGCGFLSLSDCFSCLRRGDELANALSAAQSRKGPKF